ncbi:MAG: hypothetical protein ACLVBP_00105 [Ruminococcus sp.]
MKFEAFYKEAYDAEMEELFSDHASETENKPSKDSCDLLMKKADLEFSQYKLVKSEKCYDYLLGNLYPKAAEIAKMQGGNLILDIDEERHTGKLEYWGAFLMSTSGDTLLMDFLVSAMTMADQFSFEVKDSLLHLEFFFELYNLVKMKDYSKEIEQLGLKIKKLNTR